MVGNSSFLKENFVGERLCYVNNGHFKLANIQLVKISSNCIKTKLEISEITVMFILVIKEHWYGIYSGW